MATLPEKRVNFNPKLHISHTGGELSTDAGLVLVKELMAQLNFTTLAYQLVHFDDQRHYARYSNVSLLEPGRAAVDRRLPGRSSCHQFAQ